jgi:hypothetical protein
LRAGAAGSGLGAVLSGLSESTWRSRGKQTYSTVDEKGFNKKHLPWLISIVNLGKLFKVFLRQVQCCKARCET